MPSGGETRQALGPFVVRATAAEARAFRIETGGKGSALPFTFPVRWLARQDIREAAAEMIGGTDWVPIHESQSFDYRHALAAETDYRMTIEMERQTEPPRIILTAEVGADELCLRMEMVLRIVTLPAGEAA